MALIPYIERELALRDAAPCDHAPSAWPVPRRSRRSRLPATSGRRGGEFASWRGILAEALSLVTDGVVDSERELAHIAA